MKRVRQMSDLRGFSRLAVEATVAMTDLVEEVHRSVTTVPDVGKPAPQRKQRMRGITGFVYRTIRRITHWVGHSVDGGLAQLQPLLLAQTTAPSATPAVAVPVSPHRDAVLAALNGVLGDHLEATRNPLAIPMQFRRAGRELEPAKERGSRILLLVHGLCRSDLGWLRKGHDHGAALASELGFTPVYLHYNSGQPIATNGRELALRLESLIADWGETVSEIAVVAHSMGGLVMRSACQVAADEHLAWRDRLRRIVFLGTPHHGAPLERGGHWIDSVLGASPYTAPLSRLGKIRSAGITDLRHGFLVDEDWRDRDRFARAARRHAALPLPAGVACYAIAATTGKQAGDLKDRLIGDGLVPLASALGCHAERDRHLMFPPERQWIACGSGHLDLLGNAEVYAHIRRWLDQGRLPEPSTSRTRW